MITIEVRKAEKVAGEWGLFLSFPYDEDILVFVRSLPSRFWHADAKEWEIPLNRLADCINKFNGYEVELKGELTALVEKKLPSIQFEFKTKPFDHQIDGFNYGLLHDNWLLGDQQGLGKTKTIIDLAVAKKQLLGYKHCLIICCVNGLKWNWVHEIHTHSDEDAHILGQKLNTRGKTVIGSNSDKFLDIKNIDKLPYFIITNVESLRDDDIALALKAACDAGDISMIAVDEIHKCANATSQQGKGLLKLNAANKVAMTGTPLMNTPLDLYIILKWLGYEKHAFYSFKNHYCVMGGFGGYQIVGYQHLDELQEQLNEVMLRRLKEDALDLPEKLYVDEYVEMDKKQSKIYAEILNDIRLNVDKIAESPNPLSQLIRLRQATGFTGILSTDILVSAKLDRMEEMVDEAVANGKKVVVFSNWTDITDEVLRRLERFNPATITGKIDDNDLDAQKDKFQYDDSCKVIVGTTPKMGTGFTLTAGTVVFFVDEPWNDATKEQAVDRCHRIGTVENITIYTLITKNTIDERIHEIVHEKGALSADIIDGKVVGDKRQLIDYLLS